MKRKSNVPSKTVTFSNAVIAAFPVNKRKKLVVFHSFLVAYVLFHLEVVKEEKRGHTFASGIPCYRFTWLI